MGQSKSIFDNYRWKRLSPTWIKALSLLIQEKSSELLSKWQAHHASNQVLIPRKTSKQPSGTSPKAHNVADLTLCTLSSPILISSASLSQRRRVSLRARASRMTWLSKGSATWSNATFSTEMGRSANVWCSSRTRARTPQGRGSVPCAKNPHGFWSKVGWTLTKVNCSLPCPCQWSVSSRSDHQGRGCRPLGTCLSSLMTSLKALRARETLSEPWNRKKRSLLMRKRRKGIHVWTLRLNVLSLASYCTRRT